MRHELGDRTLPHPPEAGCTSVGLADRRDAASRARLVSRLRAEFDEMLSLAVTVPQARRLFGLAQDTCQRVLQQLVNEGVLRRRPDGRYSRGGVGAE